MNNFESIKQQWAQRKIPTPPDNEFNSILEKSKRIRKKQSTGQIVLGVTVVVLGVFFLYVSAHQNARAFLGLGLMIGCLVVRIGIEFLSMIKKNNIPTDQNMRSYVQNLIGFYKRRKIVHFIITPFLFFGYIVGFWMLLPIFKFELSAGFYTYILISSTLIFTALAILIVYQVCFELRLLKEIIHESLI